MGNCLVTKLKGVINNDNLIKINEFEICSVNSSVESTIAVGNANGNVFSIRTKDSSNKLKLQGDNDFTSQVEISGYQKLTVVLAAGRYDLIIVDKENLQRFEAEGPDIFQFKHLNDLKYCTSFESGVFRGHFFNFDISEIDGSSICVLQLIGDGITGDISNLSFPNYNLGETMHYLEIGATTPQEYYGSMNSIIASTNSYIISFRGAKSLTGNVSLASQNCKVLDLRNSTNNCTWGSIRPSEYPRISLNNVFLGDYVDAMLKNQAQCQNNPYSKYDKQIIVFGTHNTSDADAVAAIASIKADGWTVIINGITM